MINTPILPPERPFYIDQDGDICDANGWLVCCPARDVWPDGDNAHAKDLLMVLNRRAVSFEEHNRLVEKAVRAALERAVTCCEDELRNTAMLMSNPPKSSAAWDAANSIRKLASDPAEVAAIIKKAGGIGDE